MRYAGFWIRFAAITIDSIIFLVFFLVFFISWYMIAPNSYDKYILSDSFSFLIYFVSGFFSWLYSALLWSSSWQATIGKKILSLKVVDPVGEKITFLNASGRYFAQYVSSFVFCLGYISVAFDKQKRSWHDKLANTFVINTSKSGNFLDDRFSNNQMQNNTHTNRLESENGNKILLAGFDAGGHVVRLIIDKNNSQLAKTGLTLGRDGQYCELHLNDTSVSRTHIRFILEKDSLWIEDLNSTNGTTVNGKRLIANVPTELPDRGNIMIGDVELSISEF
jgi:uncharacterized RDD family membrane protein YckC